PRAIISQPASMTKMEAVARELSILVVLSLDSQGGGTLVEQARAMGEDFETVARSATDLAAILYTSGTTGRSKGAMLSHGNLASNALVLHRYWGFRPDDVLLHVLPLFHVHGLFVACHCALLNGTAMRFHL